MKDKVDIYKVLVVVAGFVFSALWIYFSIDGEVFTFTENLLWAVFIFSATAFFVMTILASREDKHVLTHWVRIKNWSLVCVFGSSLTLFFLLMTR